MKPVGRPRFKPDLALWIWTFAELMRDRKEKQLRRFSERDGCQRLERTLRKDTIGGRWLKLPTIRKHHSDVKAALRDGRISQANASFLLAYGRARREILGWDSSPWLFLIDPDLLPALGYQVTDPAGIEWTGIAEAAAAQAIAEVAAAQAE
jgi:PAS domain-containing protein